MGDSKPIDIDAERSDIDWLLEHLHNAPEYVTPSTIIAFATSYARALNELYELRGAYDSMRAERDVWESQAISLATEQGRVIGQRQAHIADYHPLYPERYTQD